MKKDIGKALLLSIMMMSSVVIFSSHSNFFHYGQEAYYIIKHKDGSIDVARYFKDSGDSEKSDYVDQFTLPILFSPGSDRGGSFGNSSILNSSKSMQGRVSEAQSIDLHAAVVPIGAVVEVIGAHSVVCTQRYANDKILHALKGKASEIPKVYAQYVEWCDPFHENIFIRSINRDAPYLLTTGLLVERIKKMPEGSIEKALDILKKRELDLEDPLKKRKISATYLKSIYRKIRKAESGLKYQGVFSFEAFGSYSKLNKLPVADDADSCLSPGGENKRSRC